MQKYIVCALSILALCVNNSSAQPDFKTAKGLKLGISEPALIEQYLSPVAGIGSNVRDLLEHKTLKSCLMPVREAGPGADEMAYILAAALEFYVNLNRNYKDNLSPDYISLNLNVAGKQASAAESLTFLAQTGTVSAAIMPYGANTISGAVFSTKKYKIANYLHLFRELTKESQRVFETKKALMRGHPVIVECNADDSLSKLRNARFWSPASSTTAQRRHTFLVVGFDENLEAFELMGCMGTDWASGGYVWIKYTDFGKLATNGFVLIPDGFN